MESLRRIQDIEVKLVGAIEPPYEISVASARTCYSGKGIFWPEDVSKDEKSIALRDKIASSTLEAGHLTTRQHAHFTFAISGVSRHFLWNFLHSHPYYNSEQVSQRYVKVRSGNYLMLPMEAPQEEIYRSAVQLQRQAYEELIEALREPISKDFYQRFPARGRRPEAWKSSIEKRVYEIARYVLGVGTTAYLYHTVSALTLLRYAKLQKLFETPMEQRAVIELMLARVREIDPLFEKELVDPTPIEQTLEFRMFQETGKPELGAESSVQAFDARLEGRISKLTAYSQNAEKTLADAFRFSVGKSEAELSDAAALALLLDPQNNKQLADTLNTPTLDRLSQMLHHVSFTFYKKLSHTADSQDQRHRTVLSSRPFLKVHYTGKPDYLTPFGVTQSERAGEIYRNAMEKTFEAINRLIDSGVSTETAFYLLPNAFPIRMVSTGDLLGLFHKWKLRACYNAQEEIFRATLDEITQVRELFPRLAEHFRAPCYVRLRAGVKPYCPEGERFCGMPVWKLDVPQYERKSL